MRMTDKQLADLIERIYQGRFNAPEWSLFRRDFHPEWLPDGSARGHCVFDALGRSDECKFFYNAKTHRITFRS